MTPVIKQVVKSKAIPLCLVARFVATLNAKKIGKHRRGTLVLQRINWSVQHIGDIGFYEYVLYWERPRYKAFLVRHNDNTMKLIPILNYTDHNKLMKILRSNRHVCQ